MHAQKPKLTASKWILLSLALLITTQVAAQQQPWQKIPIPPLPTFPPQDTTSIQLPNGMVIMLQEDHELPLISATALVKGGSSSEPASKVGLVSIYASTWRTGGTETKTGDQLDDELEAIAARVEAGGSIDTTSLSFNCLKQNFDQVFAAFLDLQIGRASC